jgi:hypothetical protein
METVTQSLNDFFNAATAYMQTGFYRINAVQGLLIAMFAAYLMPAWGRIFVVAFGATLGHLILDVMLPVLANNAAFRLPPIVDPEYWRYALALYVGYLLVITVFYVIKRMMLGGKHA